MASLGWVTVSERRSMGFTVRQYMGVTAPLRPAGFTMRPPAPVEAAAVAGVVNACELKSRGKPFVTPEDVTQTWTAPGFDLRADARVIEDGSGSPVAYAEFGRPDSPEEIFFDGFVHPGSRSIGLGTWILDWGEERAAEIASRLPAGRDVKLQHMLWVEEGSGATLLASRGFSVVRHFYELLIELDPPSPPPAWPWGIEVRNMEAGDERPLHAADEEAFGDHWGFIETPFDIFSHFNLEGENFDPALVFLALDGDQIAGASICRKHRAEDAAKGWVGDLFVRRPWRRRGIARALLLASFSAYRERGYERVGLGVDAESPTGALDLYLNTGMTVDSEALCFEKVLSR